MNPTIIVCRGSAFTPPRFWAWGTCKEDYFLEKLKEQGWVQSKCYTYLTPKQLIALNE